MLSPCLKVAGLLQAAAALQLALTEGYGRALRVHAQDVDALLGAGEVHLQVGRLAASGEHQLLLQAQDIFFFNTSL